MNLNLMAQNRDFELISDLLQSCSKIYSKVTRDQWWGACGG